MLEQLNELQDTDEVLMLELLVLMQEQEELLDKLLVELDD